MRRFKQSTHRISTVRILFVGLIISLLAQPMLAHAILLESSPAANTKITGTDVPVKLRFNVRIDVSRSRLILVHPDGSQQALTIKKDTAADIVASDAVGLVPGAYRLRWQVLASDGHITRGEVLFSVTSA